MFSHVLSSCGVADEHSSHWHLPHVSHCAHSETDSRHLKQLTVLFVAVTPDGGRISLQSPLAAWVNGCLPSLALQSSHTKSAGAAVHMVACTHPHRTQQQQYRTGHEPLVQNQAAFGVNEQIQQTVSLAAGLACCGSGMLTASASAADFMSPLPSSLSALDTARCFPAVPALEQFWLLSGVFST
jgi:hypothetical protein